MLNKYILPLALLLSIPYATSFTMEREHGKPSQTKVKERKSLSIQLSFKNAQTLLEEIKNIKDAAALIEFCKKNGLPAPEASADFSMVKMKTLKTIRAKSMGERRKFVRTEYKKPEQEEMRPESEKEEIDLSEEEAFTELLKTSQKSHEQRATLITKLQYELAKQAEENASLRSFIEQQTTDYEELLNENMQLQTELGQLAEEAEAIQNDANTEKGRIDLLNTNIRKKEELLRKQKNQIAKLKKGLDLAIEEFKKQQ